MPGQSMRVGASDREEYTDAASPVTLVLLAYNHARFLPEALDSVRGQELRPCHLIVVDDASSDSSASVVREYLGRSAGRITTVFHRTNRGLTRTLNETLALVDSEYVAFLAADDWMEPQRFRLQTLEFERLGERCAIVHSDMYRVDENGHRLEGSHWEGRLPVHPDMFVASIPRCAIAAPSALLRTSAVRLVGEYDESLPMEDHDMWLRLCRHYDAGYVDAPLTNYRIVSTSLSHDIDLWTFRSVHLASLSKHLDLQGRRGLAVAQHMQHLGKILYFHGEDPTLIRRYLSKTLSRHWSPESAILLAASTLRIPGPSVAGLYQLLRMTSEAVVGFLTRRPKT